MRNGRIVSPSCLPLTNKQQQHLPYLSSSPPHRKEKSVCFPFHPFRHCTTTTRTINKGKEEKTRKRPRASHPFVASLFTEPKTPSRDHLLFTEGTPSRTIYCLLSARDQLLRARDHLVFTERTLSRDHLLFTESQGLFTVY